MRYMLGDIGVGGQTTSKMIERFVKEIQELFPKAYETFVRFFNTYVRASPYSENDRNRAVSGLLDYLMVDGSDELGKVRERFLKSFDNSFLTHFSHVHIINPVVVASSCLAETKSVSVGSEQALIKVFIFPVFFCLFPHFSIFVVNCVFLGS